MNTNNTCYKEIFKLKNMLEKEGIDFHFHDRSSLYTDFEFYQIIIYKKNIEEYAQLTGVEKEEAIRLVSAIEGSGTYGSEDDLLEIMGLLTEEEKKEDTVVGWLTAENVFNRIMKAIKEGEK